MQSIYSFFRFKKTFFREYSVILLSTLLLTSCYDAVEIDDEVYALVLGVDRGTKNAFQLTLQYPVYKKSGDNGGMAKQKNPFVTGESITHTVEAASILQGLDILGMSVSRRISLKHAKAIILSEEISKAGIRDLLTAVIRYREARQSMQIMICKEKASDFILKNTPLIGDSPSKAIELMFSQSSNTGYFPRVNVAKFYTNMLSDFSDAYAAYTVLHEKAPEDANSSPEKPENKAEPFSPNIQFIPGKLPIDDGNTKEYTGTALFQKDKMMGVLNPDETRLLLMLNGSYKRGFITIKDHHEKHATLVVDTRLGRKPKIKASLLDQKPVFDIYVDIEGDILSIDAQTKQTTLGNMMDIQNQLQTYLYTEMNQFIEKIQKKYHSDVLKLGLRLSKRFPTIDDYRAYQFSKHYPDADINIHLTVNIRRSGLLLHSGIFNLSPYRNP